MAKKQALAKEIKETAVAATKVAPRVRAARHRAVSSTVDQEVPQARQEVPTPEMIAKIAYGYWESRGYTGGDSVSDWLRAEAEMLSRS